MNQIDSGTIFQFEIPFDLGIGYCKVVDFSNLSKFDGIIVKVYDCFNKENVASLDSFRNLPFFMNEIPICKMPTLRGKYAWKKVGVLAEENDSFVPMYKEYEYEGFGFETIQEYEQKNWYALINLQERIGPLPFNKVRHLEELFLRSTATIEDRVAMTLLRYKGIDVKDFFEKNSKNDSWKVDYKTQRFIPLYKTIPEEIRGKPLIKGYVPDKYLNYNWDGSVSE